MFGQWFSLNTQTVSSYAPRLPGLYLIRQLKFPGDIVYIGRAEEIRARLHDHCHEADNPALAYEVRTGARFAFDVESNAFVRTLREMVLIRDLQPRCNRRAA